MTLASIRTGFARPFPRPALILAALLALLAPAVSAQDTPELPTSDAVQAALDGLEALGLEEPVRNEARDAYQQAQQALKQLAEWRARLQDFESKTANAAKDISDLQAALAATVERPTVTVPPGASLSQMEQSQAEAKAELEQARRRLDELQAEARLRTERRTAVAQELTEAREQMEAARAALQALATESGEPARARRTLAQARWHLASVQERTLNAEIASYDARKDLLPLRTEQAARRVARAEVVVQDWRQLVEDKRAEEATRAAEQAAATRREITRRFPRLSQWADRNEELLAAIDGPEGITRQKQEARLEAQAEQSHLAAVKARYLATLRKVRAVGTTEEMGLLLRREGERLDSVQGLERRLLANRRRLSQAQYQLILLEEEQGEVEAGEVNLQRNLVESAAPGGQVGDLDTVIRELVSTRKERLTTLITDTREYATALGLLNNATKELLEITEAYRAYIDSRILWVPSVTGPLVPQPEHYWNALTWLVDPGEWVDATGRALKEWSRHRVVVVLLALLLVALYGLTPWARRRLAALAEEAGSWRRDTFAHILQALGLTLLLAAPLALLLWTLGWFLSQPPDQREVGLAVGEGLMAAAGPCFVLRFLVVFLRQGGMAEAHLRWPAQGLPVLRRKVSQAVLVLVPLILVVSTMEHQREETWNAAVGRTAFVAAMVFLAWVMSSLRPAGAVLGNYFSRNPGTLMERFHWLWYPVAVALPAGLALAAMAGYYATALTLARQFQSTIGLSLLLVVINALFLRWLFLERRRLAIEQARQRAQAQAKAQAEDMPEDAPTESGSVTIDEDSVSIPDVDAQTRQLLRSALVAVLLVGLYGIWANALPALRILERVQVWPRLEVLAEQEAAPLPTTVAPSGGAAATTSGAGSNGGNGGNGGTEPAAEARPTGNGDSPEAPAAPTGTVLPGMSGMTTGTAAPAGGEAGVEPVTLAHVGMALVIVFFMLVAARNIPGLLEIALQRLEMDSGSRFALSTLLRYLILIVGSAVAFGAIGIGWGQVQWLAAALTFGLAFGLQEIFANFVSGLIILLERPIRVGDIVTVAGVEGRVTRLRMRSTTILDWDRRELLVPNKEFITGSLVNWTLSDPVTRLVIPVGIAYGSDTKKARELLLKAAREHPQVLDQPKPSAIFRGFGSSSLDFELRVFMGNRDYWPRLVDGLHSAIDDEFRTAGIEIAFPQLDLHVRDVPRGMAGDAAPEQAS